MLTGQPAFGGEDVMLTLARVLDRETDLSSIPKTISPAVRHTLKLCLEKDPRKRIADIRDVRLALEGRFESELPKIAAETAAAPLWKRALPHAGVAIVAGAIMFVVGGGLEDPPAPENRPVSRFAEPLEDANLVHVAISADGTALGYSAGFGTNNRPVVRRLDEFDFRPVEGAVGGNGLIPPCFSPDASWIAYMSANGTELRKIPVAGGGYLELTVDRTNLLWCDWADDGYIYYSAAAGLFRIPESGGDSELLVSTPDDGGNPVFPRLLPGGGAVLFTALSGALGTGAELDVAVLDLATGDVRTVLESAGFASFVPERVGSSRGHLIYGRDSSVFAAPFDLETLTAGSRSPVLSGVLDAGPLSFPRVSETGTLVYIGGSDVDLGAQMVWVDRAGNDMLVRQQPFGPSQGYALSPTDDRAVMAILDIDALSSDLWVFEFDGGRLTPVTRNGASQYAVWMSDGERLIYANASLDTPDEPAGRVLVGRADNAGATRTLVTWQGPAPAIPLSLSPDDGILLGARSRGAGRRNDIWALSLAGTDDEPATEDAFEYLFESPFNEIQASFSPDGNYIAYTSDESGRNEVYVAPYPGPGDRVPISSNGGTMPAWNPAGGELFYIEGDRMMVVEIETGPGFRRSAPVELFESPALLNNIGATTNPRVAYSVSSDGTRFLMPKSPDTITQSLELRIVLNWTEELARLAPFD